MRIVYVVIGIGYVMDNELIKFGENVCSLCGGTYCMHNNVKKLFNGLVCLDCNEDAHNCALPIDKQQYVSGGSIWERVCRKCFMNCTSIKEDKK